MEQTDLNIEQLNTQPEKRPDFLTVLCILSYIWSGLVLFALFLCLIFSGFIFETLQNINTGAIEMPPMDENQQKAIDMLLNLGKGKFSAIIAVAIIVYMTSLLGVFKMWKQQKWGFYIYAGVNGFLAIYNVIDGSIFSFIISIAFIGMYAANLKHMK